MSIALVYADYEAVPAQFDAFVGSDRFGDIIFRRRRMSEWISALAEEIGVRAFFPLKTPSDAETISGALREGGFHRVLHLASWLAPAREDRARDRLRRLALVDESCCGRLGEVAVPLLAAPTQAYLQVLPQLANAEILSEGSAPTSAFTDVRLDNAFVDIRGIIGLIDLLSDAFSARHFNSMKRTRQHVVKRSANIQKIKNEHDYYHLLPHSMKPWLVMPFDLRVEPDAASYTMERLLVLDMGQQWINGSISPTEFGRFLDDMLRFFEERVRRPCSPQRARANFDALYVEKLRNRFSALEEMPAKSYIDAMIGHGTSYGSLRDLFAAYHDMLAPYRNNLPDYECIGHGDPCFSNILYEKRIRMLKFIDPKGASSEDDLYTDPYYDYAKLSHSVLGGYDFITNGLYDVTVDQRLRLRLTTPDPQFEEYATQFTDALILRGVDVRRIRLYEASLFLSMLPLHADVPRNLLAFALVAAHILDEIRKT